MSFDKYYYILRDATSEAYKTNIVTTSLPNGFINTPYDQTIEARGGTPPYTFVLYSGSIPPGLDLNASTGAITGTPTVLGDYTFTIRVTDSSAPQQTDDQEYMVNIGIFDDIEETPAQPTDFILLGNYPNPFNSSTVINLELPSPGPVRIEIYDILGKRVVTAFDGYMNSGRNEVIWNANEMTSGVYFYRVTSGNRTATQRMILIK
jgi:hypothetical protein